MSKNIKKDNSIIIFLRHGDPALPGGVYPDHMSMGLSELGKVQARTVASQLKVFPIDFIVSSPLPRARETATIISEVTGLNLRIDDRLSERFFPQLSGLDYQLIAAEIGEEKAESLHRGNSDDISLSESDNLIIYQQQICKSVAEHAATDRKITLLVSHGGPHDWYLNAVACSESNRTFQRLFSLGKCRCSIFLYNGSSIRPKSVLAVNISISEAFDLIKEHKPW